MGLKIGTVCLVKGVRNHPLAGEIVTTTSLLTTKHWYCGSSKGFGEVKFSPIYEIKGRTPPPGVGLPGATWVAEHCELLPLAPPGNPDEVYDVIDAESFIRADIIKKVEDKIGRGL
jgi:hypothetical protein